MTVRKKKHSLTLLEILIALCLAGLLLSLLWKTYHIYCRQQQATQQEQLHSYNTFFLKQRLEKLFSLVLRTKPTPPLFTLAQKPYPQPTLCLFYEGDPDPDPLYNGYLRSILYIDEAKRLCLATWSSDRQCQTELLGEEVSSLNFLFFNKESQEWQKEWPETLSQAPLFIKISYEIAGKTQHLVYKTHMPEDALFYHSSTLGGS